MFAKFGSINQSNTRSLRKFRNKKNTENLQLNQLENDLVSKKDIYLISVPNTVT